MLRLEASRLTLIANDSTLVALQAENVPEFYRRLEAEGASSWPPEPLDGASLQWLRSGLQTDPDGEGWYGWVLVADTGEARRRVVGFAILAGRPDFDGEVELGFGLAPEARGQGLAGEAVKVLVEWGLAHGATRVVAHFDAADQSIKNTLSKTGFVDTSEQPYPGVARWALAAV